MASAGKGAGVGLWIGLSDLVSHLKWAGQCLERGPCRESCLQPQLCHWPSPWRPLRGGLRPSQKLVHPAGPGSTECDSLLTLHIQVIGNPAESNRFPQPRLSPRHCSDLLATLPALPSRQQSAVSQAAQESLLRLEALLRILP